jgi:hypothetical protein
LLNFYEKKHRIGYNKEESHDEILKTILEFDLVEKDLSATNDITDEKKRIEKFIENAIHRIPLQNKNKREYLEVYSIRKNKLMLEKFKLALDLISQIEKIEPENSIVKLFLINHDTLNLLSFIKHDLFNK